MPQSSAIAGGAPARKHKALLAGGVVLGLGAAATLAGWSDDVWVSAAFNANSLQIESSVSPNGPYARHGTTDARALAGSTTPDDSTSFTTPIILEPGQTTYVPVYLRTAASTDSAATVTVSPAKKLDEVEGSGVTSDSALWTTYVEYGARAVPVANPNSPPTCGSDVFNGLLSGLSTKLLFGTTSILSTDKLVGLDSPTATTLGDPNSFPLTAGGTSTYMVCFRFFLDPEVKDGSSTSNGTSIHPYWEFTGASS